jgi:hypothetical protein
MATLRETMDEWGCRTIFQDGDLALFIDEDDGWWECGRMSEHYSHCVTTKNAAEAVSYYMAMLAEQLSEEPYVPREET